MGGTEVKDYLDLEKEGIRKEYQPDYKKVRQLISEDWDQFKIRVSIGQTKDENGQKVIKITLGSETPLTEEQVDELITCVSPHYSSVTYINPEFLRADISTL